MPESPFLLSAGVAIVAFIYALVGHGGASGYLGLLTHSSLAVNQVPIVALLINCVVAMASFLMFRQAKGFKWNLCWPLLMGSMPMALMGSGFKLGDRTYYWLVAFALAVSAIRLLWAPTTNPDQSEFKSKVPLTPLIAIPIGAAIGLLSGMIGVGGGIFLSPILLLMKWADPKTTSATSAIFIVGNSLIGLAGRLSNGATIPENTLPLVLAGLIGGVLGAYVGAFRIPPKMLQRSLGLVLLFAAVKLCLK